TSNSGQGDAASIAISTDNFLIDGGRINTTNSGQGDAGNISIAVSDGFTASNGSFITSNIGSSIGNPAVGRVGNIEITAREIAFDNGANIQAGAFSGGTVEDSGTVSLSATESISFTGTNTGIFSNNDPSSFGNASDAQLSAPTITIEDGGTITSRNSGQGDAASIAISTDNFVIDGGTITSSNSGQGDAGSISIAVSDEFTANNGSLITSNIGSPIGEPALGRVGNIEITAREIALDNRAQIQAGAFSGGTVEDSGTVSLTATESISFTGTNTGIFTNNDPGSFGNASDAQLSAPTITIEDGGLITSRNSGQGDAASIAITTDNFLIDDGSITSTNSGQGDAGSISIAVSDGFTATNSVISSNIGNRSGASTVGRVGNIEITAKEISFDNTAQIQAGAFFGATAEDSGIVSLTATESISFTGRNTGIFTNNDPGSFGNASNTQLFAPTITLNDRAGITVSNDANGQGGNLTIETEQLNLNNNARILANAAGSGNGGNIILNVTKDITLRDNSFISARALEDANGGNLDIDARFIIAFPSRGNGNDIIATAERGNGGNININARQIFNLQEGNAIDSDGNFFPNNSNDIDASSQAQGLDGTVAINTPDVDPLRGATELPTNPVSAETIANNACSANGSSDQQSTFIMKGKGGIPPVPTATLFAEPLLIDSEPIQIQSNLSRSNNINEPINPHYIPANIKPFVTDNGNIYPARGIVKTADGKIILTAYPTTKTTTRTLETQLGCN
ncbi:MAG: beta strand repeat-containing protein, partial [Xenococcus sp. (in: cyanobacteria)]